MLACSGPALKVSGLFGKYVYINIHMFWLGAPVRLAACPPVRVSATFDGTLGARGGMRASVPVAAILTISAVSSAAAQRPELRPQGYVQVLGRYFAQDRADAAADEFVLRRVRAILDGNVIAPVSFRIGVEFGGSAAGDLLDGARDQFLIFQPILKT